MKHAFLAAMLCLVGCGGGPDFTGTYSGTLAETGPCTDGSSINTTDTGGWVVSESGENFVATTQGGCSPVTGTINGNTVTITPSACPATSSQGWNFLTNITDGTATLSGKSLAVIAHITIAGHNPTSGATASCAVTDQGNIARP